VQRSPEEIDKMTVSSPSFRPDRRDRASARAGWSQGAESVAAEGEDELLM
jgi:hypothetical protein